MQKHHKQSDLFIFNFPASGFSVLRPFSFKPENSSPTDSSAFASRFVAHLEFILESIVLQLLTHFPHCGCFKFFDPPPFEGWRLIPLALSAGQI